VTSRPARAQQQAGEQDPSGQTKVTISIPTRLLNDIRHRARGQGTTVTELVRRAVTLERILYEDPSYEVVLRDRQTGRDVAISVL
jgi:hypothetical protein